jgi:hypothetical protein
MFVVKVLRRQQIASGKRKATLRLHRGGAKCMKR